MKSIVITGSTRGIGYGMAEAFLARGCGVVISGRTEASTQEAISRLGNSYPPERILAQPCPVEDPAAVQTLWDAASQHFGHVDIWINNAGISGPQSEVWTYSSDEAVGIVNTNILGTIFGAQTAVRGMLTQGYGAIYNLAGFGSNGSTRVGMALYGTSKAGISYFTKALAKELRDSPLIIGALQPGMVITEMVMQHYVDKPDELARVRGIFNIIADRVENVTPWLVERMLANRKSGSVLAYAPMWKLLPRFLLAPVSRRDVFAS
ncbi:MAG: SDR family oxidoreductase [Chloroflexi bacterium]|jgi:NAD(P)-dependent dehydrogenase (short-subunit alcohol dehydrogenase family)|nr:SDR family oxidoreductase [Chloroflexota bacterium]